MPHVSRLQFRKTGTGHHREQGDCILDVYVLPALVAGARATNGKGGPEAAHIDRRGTCRTFSMPVVQDERAARPLVLPRAKSSHGRRPPSRGRSRVQNQFLGRLHQLSRLAGGPPVAAAAEGRVHHRRQRFRQCRLPVPTQRIRDCWPIYTRCPGRAAIFFSLTIIIVSFVPVFLLEAQEGRMFRPLAFTKTFAMIFASALSITLVQVLMTMFIRGKRLKPESKNPISRFFTWFYAPILRLALAWKWTALFVNFAVVPLTIPLLFVIGSEFMPPLYEGSQLYMPTSPPGLSITEATRMLQIQDKVLRTYPEVERVFGTVGRGTTPTDNTPMGMVNTTVMLKPREQWRAGMTLEKLQAEMDAEMQFPGFPNVWTQPIRNRLDMLLTGIKTPVGIKILGSDLNEIQRIGGEIERLLQNIPGTRSVYAERVAQGYFTDIRIDREAIERYGLRVSDVQDVIESAIGGQNITRTIEGRERYPVSVRYERGFRDTLSDLERVLVKTPAGAQIPLGQLAEITFA